MGKKFRIFFRNINKITLIYFSFFIYTFINFIKDIIIIKFTYIIIIRAIYCSFKIIIKFNKYLSLIKAFYNLISDSKSYYFRVIITFYWIRYSFNFPFIITINKISKRNTFTIRIIRISRIWEYVSLLESITVVLILKSIGVVLVIDSIIVVLILKSIEIASNKISHIRIIVIIWFIIFWSNWWLLFWMVAVIWTEFRIVKRNRYRSRKVL